MGPYERGFIRTTNAIMDMIEMIIVGIGYALRWQYWQE